MVHSFFRNRKDDNYKKIVERMLTAYEAEGYKIHLKYFPQNLGSYSEEQVPSRSEDNGKYDA